MGRDGIAECLARTAHVGERHVAAGIEDDGRQPEELSRTRPHAYSVFNLDGLATLARLYEHVDVGLWSSEKRYAGSIRAALDWLAGELDDRTWETGGNELVPFPVEDAFSSLGGPRTRTTSRSILVDGSPDRYSLATVEANSINRSVDQYTPVWRETCRESGTITALGSSLRTRRRRDTTQALSENWELI